MIEPASGSHGHGQRVYYKQVRRVARVARSSNATRPRQLAPGCDTIRGLTHAKAPGNSASYLLRPASCVLRPACSVIECRGRGATSWSLGQSTPTGEVRFFLKQLCLARPNGASHGQTMNSILYQKMIKMSCEPWCSWSTWTNLKHEF